MNKEDQTGSGAAMLSTQQAVVVLSTDLMDRSKISGALPQAVFVRSVADLLRRAQDADVVVVDLNKLANVADLESIEQRIIAFGSHVDEAQLEAAAEAGAEAFPRSVFFRRLTQVADGR